MQAKRGGHPDERTLEAYLLGSLPLRKAKQIEEHVLACPECVGASEELDHYLRSMRAALGSEKPKLAIARKAPPG